MRAVLQGAHASASLLVFAHKEKHCLTVRIGGRFQSDVLCFGGYVADTLLVRVVTFAFAVTRTGACTALFLPVPAPSSARYWLKAPPAPIVNSPAQALPKRLMPSSTGASSYTLPLSSPAPCADFFREPSLLVASTIPTRLEA